MGMMTILSHCLFSLEEKACEAIVAADSEGGIPALLLERQFACTSSQRLGDTECLPRMVCHFQGRPTTLPIGNFVLIDCSILVLRTKLLVTTRTRCNALFAFDIGHE